MFIRRPSETVSLVAVSQEQLSLGLSTFHCCGMNLLLGLDKICLAKFEQNGQPKERSNSATKMGCLSILQRLAVIFGGLPGTLCYVAIQPCSLDSRICACTLITVCKKGIFGK